MTSVFSDDTEWRKNESLVPPTGVQHLVRLAKVCLYVQELMKTCAGTERTCIEYTSVASACLRGQGQLGCHLAAVYSHAQLSRLYPWFYLNVMHMRSIPRRTAFLLEAKKIGTAGFEAICGPYPPTCGIACDRQQKMF